MASKQRSGAKANQPSANTSSAPPQSSKTRTAPAKKLNEVDKLELDNRRMEEQLAALREALEKQKALRGKSEFVWRGGQQNRSVSAYAHEVLAQKNVALKAKKSGYSGVGAEADAKRSMIEKAIALHKKQQDAPRNPVPPTLKPASDPARANFLLARPYREVRDDHIEPTPSSTKEPTKELRQWRVPTALGDGSRPSSSSSLIASSLLPYKPPPSYSDVMESRKKVEMKNQTPTERDPDEPEKIENGGGAFFEGQFNETESRASFLEALNAWRSTSDIKDTTQGPQREGVENEDASTGTEGESISHITHSEVSKVIVDLLEAQKHTQPTTEENVDGSAMSYMDRLLLHKYRTESTLTLNPEMADVNIVDEKKSAISTEKILELAHDAGLVITDIDQLKEELDVEFGEDVDKPAIEHLIQTVHDESTNFPGRGKGYKKNRMKRSAETRERISITVSPLENSNDDLTLSSNESPLIEEPST
ncbi:hypothetical protein BJ742DRAFT_859021 [Cladochytrium replicatum]|nr:hypothetical protein BJ742DRAFT_859021 [Cladochytrium replicatum]